MRPIFFAQPVRADDFAAFIVEESDPVKSRGI
jgi:hypothetical protein